MYFLKSIVEHDRSPFCPVAFNKMFRLLLIYREVRSYCSQYEYYRDQKFGTLKKDTNTREMFLRQGKREPSNINFYMGLFIRSAKKTSTWIDIKIKSIYSLIFFLRRSLLERPHFFLRQLVARGWRRAKHLRQTFLLQLVWRASSARAGARTPPRRRRTRWRVDSFWML